VTLTLLGTPHRPRWFDWHRPGTGRLDMWSLAGRPEPESVHSQGCCLYLLVTYSSHILVAFCQQLCDRQERQHACWFIGMLVQHTPVPAAPAGGGHPEGPQLQQPCLSSSATGLYLRGSHRPSTYRVGATPLLRKQDQLVCKQRTYGVPVLVAKARAVKLGSYGVMISSARRCDRHQLKQLGAKRPVREIGTHMQRHRMSA